MKIKNSLISIQRFALIELETIFTIFLVYLLLNLFSMPELDVTHILWLNFLFILTAFPMFFYTKKRNIQIWIFIMSVVWVITGIWLGVHALWVTVVLGIWRSIVVLNEQKYLFATYKRVIYIMVLLTIHFLISHLFETPIWWFIPIIAIGCFGCTFVVMSCQNLLEHERWLPNREDWMRICRNQLLFFIAIMGLVVILVLLRKKFIFLLAQVGIMLWKISTLFVTPLIIFLTKIISYLYEIIASGRGVKRPKFNLTEIFKNVEVNDNSITTSNGVWLALFSIAILVLLFIFAKKIIKNFFDKEAFKGEIMDDWVEVVEAEPEIEIKNSLLSTLKSLKIFGSNQKLDKIRLLYRDFLKTYYQRVKNNNKSSNVTTRDIIQKATEQLPADYKELEILTKVYEDHRYGGNPSTTATIDQMKKSVEKWMKSLKKL